MEDNRTYEVHIYENNDIFDENAQSITLYPHSNNELEKMVYQMVVVHKKACVILPG